MILPTSHALVCVPNLYFITMSELGLVGEFFIATGVTSLFGLCKARRPY